MSSVSRMITKNISLSSLNSNIFILKKSEVMRSHVPHKLPNIVGMVLFFKERDGWLVNGFLLLVH